MARWSIGPFGATPLCPGFRLIGLSPTCVDRPRLHLPLVITPPSPVSSLSVCEVSTHLHLCILSFFDLSCVPRRLLSFITDACMVRSAPPFRPPVLPSCRPSICPSVHPSFRPSICPSVLPPVRRGCAARRGPQERNSRRKGKKPTGSTTKETVPRIADARGRLATQIPRHPSRARIPFGRFQRKREHARKGDGIARGSDGDGDGDGATIIGSGYRGGSSDSGNDGGSSAAGGASSDAG